MNRPKSPVIKKRTSTKQAHFPVPQEIKEDVLIKKRTSNPPQHQEEYMSKSDKFRDQHSQHQEDISKSESDKLRDQHHQPQHHPQHHSQHHPQHHPQPPHQEDINKSESNKFREQHSYHKSPKKSPKKSPTVIRKYVPSKLYPSAIQTIIDVCLNEDIKTILKGRTRSEYLKIFEAYKANLTQKDYSIIQGGLIFMYTYSRVNSIDETYAKWMIGIFEIPKSHIVSYTSKKILESIAKSVGVSSSGKAEDLVERIRTVIDPSE